MERLLGKDLGSEEREKEVVPKVRGWEREMSSRSEYGWSWYEATVMAEDAEEEAGEHLMQWREGMAKLTSLMSRMGHSSYAPSILSAEEEKQQLGRPKRLREMSVSPPVGLSSPGAPPPPVRPLGSSRSSGRELRGSDGTQRRDELVPSNHAPDGPGSRCRDGDNKQWGSDGRLARNPPTRRGEGRRRC